MLILIISNKNTLYAPELGLIRVISVNKIYNMNHLRYWKWIFKLALGVFVVKQVQHLIYFATHASWFYWENTTELSSEFLQQTRIGNFFCLKK